MLLINKVFKKTILEPRKAVLPFVCLCGCITLFSFFVPLFCDISHSLSQILTTVVLGTLHHKATEALFVFPL